MEPHVMNEQGHRTLVNCIEKIGSMIVSMLFLAASVCAADAPRASVTINYPGIHDLSAAAQSNIRAAAIDLLKTSNFNSLDHAKVLHSRIPEIQDRYRKTVSGHLLVISFDSPQKIETIGGEVTVYEIVVGLNRSDYADQLFTIDTDGRVIEHGKYSGPKCIQLLDAIKEAAKNIQSNEK